MHDSENPRESIEEFGARADTWLSTSIPPRWKSERGALSTSESDAIRRDWDRTLSEAGFAGLSLPKEFGGQGMGLAEEVAFHVLAAKAQAPDGLARIGKILTAPLLVRFGTVAQQARYLPKILNGEEIWCQGFSEPTAGSDLASIASRATRVSGGYHIRGRKTWTSFVQHADRCLMLVQTDEQAPRYKNLSLFLVDMRQAGVTVDDIRQISGAVHFAEVQFTDVFVSDDDRVGADGEGWKLAMSILSDERGGAEAATRYVEIRSDIDALLETCGDRPDLAAELSALDIRAEALRWHLSKVVDLEGEQGEAFLRAVSVLKVVWSELWQDVTRAGWRAGNPDDREHWRFQYLESRSASIYSGTNEIQRNIMAERVLGLPR
ncbi:acyl-CoA dehydrogenase [Cryobacterium glaciale]|uniref:Acyl-CoA dehydrogenase n=1 Tax=Cryobacterium glaciale TaxID=1259145 RepID=A0A4R8V6R7_9MICO|nr:acyl-CoA dehydrogenase family protein [Cryobacterium glaciale]TFB77309.1 acyl-CoA dehydrogenase [Cryobacterium glaciale]